ncbi:MAG: hypothetical protein ACRYGP_28310 [Janthinobacterium lividum]
MTEDERLFFIGQIPDTVPGRPGEAREKRPDVDPRMDPEQVYATPAWRREPTTEFDPRKGR